MCDVEAANGKVSWIWQPPPLPPKTPLHDVRNIFLSSEATETFKRRPCFEKNVKEENST